MDGRQPSVQDVSLEAAGCSHLGLRQRGTKRLWRTADGDEIALFLTLLPPDLPRDGRVWRDFRHFFQAFLEGSQGTVIDCAIREVGGCPAIATAYAMPQSEHSLAYIGTITIPFEAFSFVFRCRIEDRAAGGLKEAVLRSRGIPAAEYTRTCHDAEFPGHPLARVRRITNTIVAAATIADDIASLPRFALHLRA